MGHQKCGPAFLHQTDKSSRTLSALQLYLENQWSLCALPVQNHFTRPCSPEKAHCPTLRCVERSPKPPPHPQNLCWTFTFPLVKRKVSTRHKGHLVIRDSHAVSVELIELCRLWQIFLEWMFVRLSAQSPATHLGTAAAWLCVRAAKKLTIKLRVRACTCNPASFLGV